MEYKGLTLSQIVIEPEESSIASFIIARIEKMIHKNYQID